MNNRSNRLFLCYVISGVIFIAVLSANIVLKKYGDSLSDALKKLDTVRSNLTDIKDAQAGIDRTITRVNALVPSDIASKTPEDRIFTILDEIKNRMRGAEITVTNIDHKGAEVILPVTIKAAISGKTITRDYTQFVNNVGYLQSLSFPFFFIDGINMSQSQDKTSVLCEIKGSLKTVTQQQ